ncbi:thrombospondin-1-like [Diadema antillarum]|uniref:thrombospondin-1-like n=1 Tax=Diadema antillarum TaxID=105358 RepID=UPI003A842B66
MPLTVGGQPGRHGLLARQHATDVESEFECAITPRPLSGDDSARGTRPGVWAAWEEWSECSLACNGTQTRWRRCEPLRLGAAEGLCEGEEKQSRACFLVRNPEMCNREPTWGRWTHWSYCSQTCGEGRRYRRRSCMTQPGSHSLTCRGQHRVAQPCIERACESTKGRRLYPS